jgi:hypothetical protein
VTWQNAKVAVPVLPAKTRYLVGSRAVRGIALIALNVHRIVLTVLAAQVARSARDVPLVVKIVPIALSVLTVQWSLTPTAIVRVTMRPVPAALPVVMLAVTVAV